MEETKYCAYIDVLGYNNLVKDPSLSVEKKVQMLASIYTNLASQFLIIINELNRKNEDKIYVRSFSDCFYLDSSNIHNLLIALNRIFQYTFGFYSHIPLDQATTPLLRCGVVKDWLIKFRDIGAITNNLDELNPIGLAVARAYETSEKSKFSGMRIIISPEVIEDLKPLKVAIVDFDCYHTFIEEYSNIQIGYYFKQLIKNECKIDSPYYELLWPVGRVDNVHDCINILEKIKPLYSQNIYRHFRSTVQLFLESYILNHSGEVIEHYNSNKVKLENIMNEI